MTNTIPPAELTTTTSGLRKYLNQNFSNRFFHFFCNLAENCFGVQMDEINIQYGNIIDTVAQMPPTFELVFEFKLNSFASSKADLENIFLGSTTQS